jgi:hypothetical protein
MLSTQVRTYDQYSNPVDIGIPTPTQNVPFSYSVNVPSNTVSAETRWFYRIGGINFMDTTSLVVQ